MFLVEATRRAQVIFRHIIHCGTERYHESGNSRIDFVLFFQAFECQRHRRRAKRKDILETFEWKRIQILERLLIQATVLAQVNTLCSEHFAKPYFSAIVVS